MYIEPHPSRCASSSLSSAQPRAGGSLFIGMFGPAAKLLAAIGEWRRARQATAELAAWDDRMLADIGLAREEVPFAAQDGLGRRRVRMHGLAQSRQSLVALAVVTAAVAGLTFASPARAEGEGNGDPFVLQVPGQVFSVGPTRQVQAGMDAGTQTFGPLRATREVQAAPVPQAFVGHFALQTRP